MIKPTRIRLEEGSHLRPSARVAQTLLLSGKAYKSSRSPDRQSGCDRDAPPATSIVSLPVA